jgi:1A family penicillin-binding protein
MSTSGRKTPRLVADKRHPKPRKKPAAAGTKTVKKTVKKPLKKTVTARKKAAPARRKRASPKRKRNPVLAFFIEIFRRLLGIIWKITWRVTAVGAVILALVVGYTYTTLPNLETFLDGRARGSVTLTDYRGDVFAWRGDQFGGVVSAGAVSKHLKNAVVATEDKRFYRHFGVSPRGVASAIWINLSEGRGPLSGHGGSTITQQTAKLLCLGRRYDKTKWESEKAYVSDCRRSSLGRKAKEAIFALAMELKYSKDEILSIYLNRAYMGGGAYGAEAAAQRYFGKSAARLNAAESAMLAGLLTAPTRYAPTNGLKRSQDRAATVLRLMYEQGYLSRAEMQAAQANPATLSKAAQAKAGGYFADWVMASGPEFFTRDTTEDVTIRTTLDQRLQKAAEEAMNYVFENKLKAGSDVQAAIIVMSADGAVRAMVGGRETNVSGAFNRATQAQRQTGSAFKPFVYATALDLGYSGNSTILDAPYCLDIPGSGEWCPKNYDRKYHGEVTLTEALRKSYNIPAVKLSEQVGRELVQKVAAGFGIVGDLAAGPALALGASESTLLDMTGAYAGILNGGSSVKPYGLVELRLKGDDQPLMGAGGGIGERIIRQEAAQELIYMMHEVVTSGTGRRAAIPGRPVAGKTGTTQGARDAWFLGFTADYVAGVWMGYDDNTPLTGVTGGGLPAEIWRETMLRVHEGLPVHALPMRQPAPVARPVEQQDRGGQWRRNRDRSIERMLRSLFGN